MADTNPVPICRTLSGGLETTYYVDLTNNDEVPVVCAKEEFWGTAKDAPKISNLDMGLLGVLTCVLVFLALKFSLEGAEDMEGFEGFGKLAVEAIKIISLAIEMGAEAAQVALHHFAMLIEWAT